MFATLRRHRAITSALLAVPLLVIGLSACSPTEPSATGSNGTGSNGTSGSAEGADPQFEWELKFTQCLRDEGIDIADPDPVKGVGEFTRDDAYRAASAVCEDTVGAPPSVGEKLTDEEYLQKALKMAACYRENGYDVADPASGMAIHLGSLDIPADVIALCTK